MGTQRRNDLRLFSLQILPKMHTTIQECLSFLHVLTRILVGLRNSRFLDQSPENRNSRLVARGQICTLGRCTPKPRTLRRADRWRKGGEEPQSILSQSTRLYPRGKLPAQSASTFLPLVSS